MLYPRETDDKRLVSDDQVVTHREHLLTQHRIMLLSGYIGARCNTCLQGETESLNILMALDSISHDPIKIIISSQGGELDPTFLLYDTIKLIKSPVETLGRYCASAAALLLAAGDRRYLLPHSKVMLHLAVGQMGGDIKDYEIQHSEMKKYQNKAIDILRDCGVTKSREEILADIDRDFWLEPEEAIAYGLADKIMTPKQMEGWLK